MEEERKQRPEPPLKGGENGINGISRDDLTLGGCTCSAGTFTRRKQLNELSPQMTTWATDTLLALAEAEPSFTLIDFERKLKTYLVAWKKHQTETKDRCVKNATKIANLSSLCRTTSSATLVHVFKNTKAQYLDYQVKLETALRKGDVQMRFYDTLHQLVLEEIRCDA